MELNVNTDMMIKSVTRGITYKYCECLNIQTLKKS